MRIGPLKFETTVRWYWITFLLVTIFIFYFILLIFILPKDFFWTSDQGVKFLQIKSLSEKPPSIPLQYPGSKLTDDPIFSPLTHSIFYREKWYSVFPIAYAALNVFPYRLLGYYGLYIVPSLSFLFTLVILHKMSRGFFGVQHSWIPVLGAVASPLLFYGLIVWEHSLAVCLVIASNLLLWMGIRSRDNTKLLIAGFLGSIAVWVRTDVYAMTLASIIALISVHNIKSLLPAFLCYISGFLIGIVPLWIFNSLVYGNPLGPHVMVNFQGYSGKELTNIQEKAFDFLRMRLPVLAHLFPLQSKRWIAVYSIELISVILSWLMPRRIRTYVSVVGFFLSTTVVAYNLLDYFRLRWQLTNFVEASPLIFWIPWLALRKPPVQSEGRTSESVTESRTETTGGRFFSVLGLSYLV